MITPQYTYDNTGNKIGVFLAIEDWDQIKNIPGIEALSVAENSIPDWQTELGKRELQHLADGTTELTEWSTAKKRFKL